MFYKKALSVAEEHLGPEHSLTETIKDNYNKAERKIKFNQTNHLIRDHKRKERATSNLYSTNKEKFFKKIQE